MKTGPIPIGAINFLQVFKPILETSQYINIESTHKPIIPSTQSAFTPVNQTKYTVIHNEDILRDETKN